MNDIDSDPEKDSLTSRDAFLKDLQHYRSVLGFLELDMPIQCLCLPTAIENILLDEKLNRAWDLTRHDLTKIKGLGKARIELISARLFDLFSIQI